eukprot:scaffold172413_cov23-Tisochrysis_lutea.AAC.1
MDGRGGHTSPRAASVLVARFLAAPSVSRVICVRGGGVHAAKELHARRRAARRAETHSPPREGGRILHAPFLCASRRTWADLKI